MAESAHPTIVAVIENQAVTRSCDVCCHCGDGIPYTKPYSYCLFCDLSVCDRCRRSHPRSHLSFTKRVKDYATPRGAAPDEKECSNCERTIHCRLSCDECEMAVCFDCIAEFQDDLVDHEHRNMTFIRTPDEYGLEKYGLTCDWCRRGQTLQHCERCLEGIKVGEAVYECATCLKDYDYSTILCAICWTSSSHDHEASHRFVSSQFVVDEHARDPNQTEMTCLECNKKLAIGTETIADHPHIRYQIALGLLQKEKLIFQSYRNCPRKPVRSILTIDESCHSVECGCCSQKATLNAKIYFCGICRFISCSRCAELGGARGHAHQMFPLTLKRTVPPDDFWRIATQPPHRWCALCKEVVRENASAYMECNHCRNFDICQECISKSGPLTTKHACVRETVDMTYYDPVEPSPEWFTKQAELYGKAMAAVSAQLETDMSKQSAVVTVINEITALPAQEPKRTSISMPIPVAKTSVSSVKRKPIGQAAPTAQSPAPVTTPSYTPTTVQSPASITKPSHPPTTTVQSPASITKPSHPPTTVQSPASITKPSHPPTTTTTTTVQSPASITKPSHPPTTVQSPASITKPSHPPTTTVQSPASVTNSSHTQTTGQSSLPIKPPPLSLSTQPSLAHSQFSAPMGRGATPAIFSSAHAQYKPSVLVNARPLSSHYNLQRLQQKLPSAQEVQQMYRRVRRSPKTKAGLQILKGGLQIAKIVANANGNGNGGMLFDTNDVDLSGFDFSGEGSDFASTNDSFVDFDGGADFTSITDSAIDFSGGAADSISINDSTVDFDVGVDFTSTSETVIDSNGGETVFTNISDTTVDSSGGVTDFTSISDTTIDSTGGGTDFISISDISVDFSGADGSYDVSDGFDTSSFC